MSTPRRFWSVAAFVLASSAMGCGYKFVKKSDLRVRRLAADSVHIATLEAQLDTLRVRQKQDSIRCAQLVKQLQAAPQPSTVANADSLLRGREQEIQTLRDQLTKLTAEMDRIKRRLANPKS